MHRTLKPLKIFLIEMKGDVRNYVRKHNVIVRVALKNK